MSNILVTGGTNGLGKAIVAALKDKTLYGKNHNIVIFDTEYGDDVRKADYADIASGLRNMFDTDEEIPQLDVLINCAGVNKINWLENVSDDEWDEVMDVNVKGIFKMTKACLPMLIKSKGTVLNIVSNAAHMPMTCSAAYNASKGAALILTKQMARELTKAHGITVFSVSPNKLAGTKMSDSIDAQVVRTRGWTPEYAHEYQLKGLLTGEETPPEAVAEFIAYLLQDKAHHKHLSGCDLPYGA